MKPGIEQTIVLLAVVLAGSMATASAAEPCCTHCGGIGNLRVACRPVRTTKSVEVTCWDVVEEDVAVTYRYSRCTCANSGPSGACCTTGKCVLCSTGACPKCCKIRPRNRLMRKTLLNQEPAIQWTVEYVCPSCEQELHAAIHGTAAAEGPDRRASTWYSLIDRLHAMIRR